MYRFIRPLLFRLEPESIHGLALTFLRFTGDTPLGWILTNLYKLPNRPVEAFGLKFPNCLGVAAGFDKDGLAWRGLARLGFGHIEIGTVTPYPQVGNPRPRLFRLPEDRALINRLGFPGRGADFVARQLGSPRLPGLVIGVNIGKNKDTSLEDAPEDYLYLYERFSSLADYLVVNVSSPNTVGLRRLQAKKALHELLNALNQERNRKDRTQNHKVPILVKLAPDLSDEELVDAVEVISQTGMDGVVVANTTVKREGLKSPLAGESGGLSGAPLRARSTDLVRRISQLTGGKLPIIGVGGVMD